jgi:hypothetical protein
MALDAVGMKPPPQRQRLTTPPVRPAPPEHTVFSAPAPSPVRAGLFFERFGRET